MLPRLSEDGQVLCGGERTKRVGYAMTDGRCEPLYRVQVRCHMLMLISQPLLSPDVHSSIDHVMLRAEGALLSRSGYGMAGLRTVILSYAMLKPSSVTSVKTRGVRGLCRSFQSSVIMPANPLRRMLCRFLSISCCVH